MPKSSTTTKTQAATKPADMAAKPMEPKEGSLNVLALTSFVLSLAALVLAFYTLVTLTSFETAASNGFERVIESIEEVAK